MGAKVLAVELSDEKLATARSIGAVAGLNVTGKERVVDAIRDLTDGGAHVSVDAIGNAAACINSIASLRKRGRHVQIGLMVGDDSRPGVPMDRVIANELEIVGSHGMQAYRYADMLAMIGNGSLSPEKLIGRTITLEDSIDALTTMHTFSSSGVTIISMATDDL
jgi:alcohol dehydrogenase